MVSPRQWISRADCPYVRLGNEVDTSAQPSLKTHPNGPQLCCKDFQGMVAFVGRIKTISMPNRYQEKADAALTVAISGVEPWIEFLEAKLRESDPALDLNSVIRRNVFMESNVRARFGKDVRFFDQKHNRIYPEAKEINNLLPGEYDCMGSVSIYAVNGSASLSIRLHALQRV